MNHCLRCCPNNQPEPPPDTIGIELEEEWFVPSAFAVTIVAVFTVLIVTILIAVVLFT